MEWLYCHSKLGSYRWRQFAMTIIGKYVIVFSNFNHLLFRRSMISAKVSHCNSSHCFGQYLSRFLNYFWTSVCRDAISSFISESFDLALTFIMSLDNAFACSKFSILTYSISKSYPLRRRISYRFRWFVVCVSNLFVLDVRNKKKSIQNEMMAKNEFLEPFDNCYHNKGLFLNFSCSHLAAFS